MVAALQEAPGFVPPGRKLLAGRLLKDAMEALKGDFRSYGLERQEQLLKQQIKVASCLCVRRAYLNISQIIAMHLWRCFCQLRMLVVTHRSVSYNIAHLCRAAAKHDSSDRSEIGSLR